MMFKEMGFFGLKIVFVVLKKSYAYTEKDSFSKEVIYVDRLNERKKREKQILKDTEKYNGSSVEVER